MQLSSLLVVGVSPVDEDVPSEPTEDHEEVNGGILPLGDDPLVRVKVTDE